MQCFTGTLHKVLFIICVHLNQIFYLLQYADVVRCIHVSSGWLYVNDSYLCMTNLYTSMLNNTS